MQALGEPCEGEDDFALADRLSRIGGVPIPEAIAEIRTAPVLHDFQCSREGMKEAVETFLGL